MKRKHSPSQRPEARAQRSEVRDQRSEARGQRSEVREQESESSGLDDFLEDPDSITTVAGIGLRTMTATTLLMMKKMELDILFRSSSKKKETEIGFFEMVALVWLLAADEKLILKAVRQNQWRDEVEQFGNRVPVTAIPALTKYVEECCERIGKAFVSVLPKDDGEGVEEEIPGE